MAADRECDNLHMPSSPDVTSRTSISRRSTVSDVKTAMQRLESMARVSFRSDNKVSSGLLFGRQRRKIDVHGAGIGGGWLHCDQSTDPGGDEGTPLSTSSTSLSRHLSSHARWRNDVFSHLNASPRVMFGQRIRPWLEPEHFHSHVVVDEGKKNQLLPNYDPHGEEELKEMQKRWNPPKTHGEVLVVPGDRDSHRRASASFTIPTEYSRDDIFDMFGCTKTRFDHSINYYKEL